MKKHRHHESQLLTLLLAILLSLHGCGKNEVIETSKESELESTEETITTETEAPDPVYDFDGAEYRMLNFDQLWLMFTPMDFQEMTGDVLSDAIYTRNRKVEVDLNMKYVECPISGQNHSPSDLTDHARITVSAGEDAYDMLHLSMMYSTTLVTEGLLLDLQPYEEFRFEREWWDQLINQNITFLDQQYFASGASVLMNYESMWVLYFNEDMAANLGLGSLYDLVRQGKWTLDNMEQVCETAANLNGDANFNMNMNGSCIYGLANHNGSPEHFWMSADVFTFDIRNEELNFTMEGDHFYSVMEKVAALLDPADGSSVFAHEERVELFPAQRTLMFTGEVTDGQRYRDVEFTYGILPYPKYDENQATYLTTMMAQAFGLAMPVTNRNPEQAAAITDALAKASMELVIPEYYGKVVEHKGLRNEDSIEMLDLCRRTRTVDSATIMGWDEELRAALRAKLFAGDSAVASDVASLQGLTENNALQYLTYLKENTR